LNNDKAIVVLTNFWDANILIDYGFLLHVVNGSDKVYKVNLINDNGTKNYSVDSIALSHPPLTKLPHLDHLTRLDFFCPTYDMLCRYKKDGDWASYTKDYYALLKDRKNSLKEWVNSLESNHVYFLCCWENTISGSHCHRYLLYRKFISSEAAMKRILPIYRHGEKIYKEERNGEIKIAMPTGFPTYLSSVGNMLMGFDDAESFSDGESYISFIDGNGNIISDGDEE